MERYTIPAHARFDEGKGGPWIKLTWDQADLLFHILVREVVSQAHTLTERDDLEDVLRQIREQVRLHEPPTVRPA